LPNYIIVYDADCGPCRKFKQLLSCLDVYRQIQFVSQTEADKLGLLNRIPQSVRYKSFHLISSNLDIQSGAEALLRLIGLFPLGHPISKLITLAPGGKRIVTSVYSIFSKLHDAESCKLNYKKAAE
jgi:predicted DCC family thiol-disulfide oxidoreductase YuxK